mmetsp:Transcript_4208/g.13898  ORF Transcript_4208/g.13898 Transcript_4208/m.13898 type:complete len:585 (+) Transcript_4208:1552-3306(+)
MGHILGLLALEDRADHLRGDPHRHVLSGAVITADVTVLGAKAVDTEHLAHVVPGEDVRRRVDLVEQVERSAEHERLVPIRALWIEGVGPLEGAWIAVGLVQRIPLEQTCAGIQDAAPLGVSEGVGRLSLHVRDVHLLRVDERRRHAARRAEAEDLEQRLLRIPFKVGLDLVVLEYLPRRRLDLRREEAELLRHHVREHLRRVQVEEVAPRLRVLLAHEVGDGSLLVVVLEVARDAVARVLPVDRVAVGEAAGVRVGRETAAPALHLAIVQRVVLALERLRDPDGGVVRHRQTGDPRRAEADHHLKGVRDVELPLCAEPLKLGREVWRLPAVVLAKARVWRHETHQEALKLAVVLLGLRRRVVKEGRVHTARRVQAVVQPRLAVGALELVSIVLGHCEAAARLVLVALAALQPGRNRLEHVARREARQAVPEQVHVRKVVAGEVHGVVLLLHLDEPGQLVELVVACVRHAIEVVDGRLVEKVCALDCMLEVSATEVVGTAVRLREHRASARAPLDLTRGGDEAAHRRAACHPAELALKEGVGDFELEGAAQDVAAIETRLVHDVDHRDACEPALAGMAGGAPAVR